MLVEHCYGLFLDTPGYELPKCLKEINKILSSWRCSNRQLSVENISFTSFWQSYFLDVSEKPKYVQNVLLHKYRFGCSSRDSYKRKWYIVNQAERQDPTWRIENLWFELVQILLWFKWLSNQYGYVPKQ